MKHADIAMYQAKASRSGYEFFRLPDGRLIPPLEFLVAAEQAGLSRALTRKVAGIALD